MLVRPGFEPTASRSADRRLSHWANRAAVEWFQYLYRAEKWPCSFVFQREEGGGESLYLFMVDSNNELCPNKTAFPVPFIERCFKIFIWTPRHFYMYTSFPKNTVWLGKEHLLRVFLGWESSLWNWVICGVENSVLLIFSEIFFKTACSYWYRNWSRR